MVNIGARHALAELLTFKLDLAAHAKDWAAHGAELSSVSG